MKMFSFNLLIFLNDNFFFIIMTTVPRIPWKDNAEETQCLCDHLNNYIIYKNFSEIRNIQMHHFD